MQWHEIPNFKYSFRRQVHWVLTWLNVLDYICCLRPSHEDRPCFSGIWPLNGKSFQWPEWVMGRQVSFGHRGSKRRLFIEAFLSFPGSIILTNTLPGRIIVTHISLLWRVLQCLWSQVPSAPMFVRPSKWWDPQPRPGSLVFVGGKFLPGCATPVIGTIQDKNIIWDTDTQLTLTAAIISHWE